MAVTLQINLIPPDIPHAALILPHQLRIWAPQCDEVLLIWDDDAQPHASRFPRYRALWEQCRPMCELLNQALQRDWPQLRIESVDPTACARLSDRFFNGGVFPPKDLRGGPFLAYFYGLDAARHDWVLHLDGDMLFGGHSPHWVQEAQAALLACPQALAAHPPGGPPPHPQRDASRFTSRAYLLDRRRLYGQLELAYFHESELLTRASEPQTWVAPYAAMPETLIETWMQREGLLRLDFSGSGPGLWSLHPPAERHPLFYARLPALLEALEAQRLPAIQGQDYNLRLETLEALGT
ncbi:MAG: glycosyltransferase family A protein [Candidatus Sericytochromatia bacterium]